MTVAISFPWGVRILLSAETGETLYEYGDQPLEVVRGRLVRLRCRRTRAFIVKSRWIRRQLARHPGLPLAQEAIGRRLKRDLTRMA